eukprot:Awhi_evm1s4883
MKSKNNREKPIGPAPPKRTAEEIAYMAEKANPDAVLKAADMAAAILQKKNAAKRFQTESVEPDAKEEGK